MESSALDHATYKNKGDWNPFSLLMQVNGNMPKGRHGRNAIEVKEENGKILYRVIDFQQRQKFSETFETQWGTFINHDNGEFFSWLEMPGRGTIPKMYRIKAEFLDLNGFVADGNFCDMFDCGPYAFAVSNLMHMALGMIKIIRLDQNLEVKTVYDNYSQIGIQRFEYIGRFKKETGFGLIISGEIEVKANKSSKTGFHRRTVLLQIDADGSCTCCKEWNKRISTSNSVARLDHFLYFGQNRKVTRLDMDTGEIAYFA